MLSKDDIKRILASRFENDLHKKLSEIPRPECLKDNYRAAFRIKKAIENNEIIAIVGDYDVDGVVSTALMAEFFDDLGVSYLVKIPNRFKDGYGLNENIINELENVSLIVTVDNGISANEAALLCAKKGIDLIITDHHMPSEILPKAYAIVNPKQNECDFPNIEICGAQVAWYLIAAIKDVCKLDYDMGKFLDLLCIAIVADMMELRDLNRILVRIGLNKINSSKRGCFDAIKSLYNKDKFEFDDISFLIAPLINSAGRMDDAYKSFLFLRSKNLGEAVEHLEGIVQFNNSRKDEEKQLFESSLKDIVESQNIIVTWGDGWHEGVIGIVASRLARRFKKPAFVFSVDGQRAKGSARSVGKINILKLLSDNQHLLCGFGGHKGAAGMVIDSANLTKFKEALNQSPLEMCDDKRCEELIGEINCDIVDYELLEILENFEPYGQKNPKPLFKLCDLKVKNVKLIGKDESHLKIIFGSENRCCEAMFFNYDCKPKIGDRVDILAHVNKNTFRGLVTPQLLINSIEIL